MNEQQILEGNKLIAEFMGYIFNPNKKDSAKWYKEKINDGWIMKSYHEVKYHTSWDWIMPVVEKIETDFDYKIIIYMRNCDVASRDVSEYDNQFEITARTTKIAATYEAVIKFIQWYNTSKQVTTK